MAKTRKKNRSRGKMEAEARRKNHFENGGTVAMWRGSARTFIDRKKKADKRACRGRVSHSP